MLLQCLLLSSFNDLRVHNTIDHFPLLVSESLLVAFTAPLMDLSVMQSAPKCITINVISDSMACSTGGDKYGVRVDTRELLKVSVS